METQTATGLGEKKFLGQIVFTKFHGPQNILMYEYLNMQYIKIMNNGITENSVSGGERVNASLH